MYIPNGLLFIDNHGERLGQYVAVDVFDAPFAVGVIRAVGDLYHA